VARGTKRAHREMGQAVAARGSIGGHQGSAVGQQPWLRERLRGRGLGGVARAAWRRVGTSTRAARCERRAGQAARSGAAGSEGGRAAAPRPAAPRTQARSNPPCLIRRSGFPGPDIVNSRCLPRERGESGNPNPRGARGERKAGGESPTENSFRRVRGSGLTCRSALCLSFLSTDLGHGR